MIRVLPKPVTFEEFLDWKPDNGNYELRNGVIVTMQPTGDHEEIVGFLAIELTLEFRRLELPYFIPKQALVKPPSKETGYLPDVLVLDLSALGEEPFWQKRSTVQQGSSIPIVIEVVSTNWRDDYLTNTQDYEEMGIPEYWIVDYLGLGGKRFIGDPKQPTLSIYSLIDGEYQVSQFRDEVPIHSPTFPELNLTASEVFAAQRFLGC
ncbi:MAG: Uma2 family endonuclease [Geitlerinemataceae cyanobacterium]